MKQTEWTGLYKANWSAAPLVPEAYSHLAKVAFGLAQKIYEHMLENGWLKPGSSVIDPFGGIAGFGFHAMRYGLHWQGVELEPKFVELAQKNIDLWNERYSQHFTKWGTAQILQGDSRQLGSILAGQVDGGLSSPPYANDTVHGRNGIDLSKTQRPGKNSQAAKMAGYGENTGQLSAMKEGDFDTAVSSPAYADTINNGEGPGAAGNERQRQRQKRGAAGENAYKNGGKYGTSDGQLGGMSAGDWDASVSSPVYEGLQVAKGDGDRELRRITEKVDTGQITNGELYRLAKQGRLSPHENANLDDYGQTNGQLGNDSGPTFWSAARTIVEQTYMVLKPGAYVAFVCGDFIRKGERVYFGQQWMELCQAVGFVPVEWVTAWKREPGPTQTGIFGDVDKTIDRVSFFRRLANQRNPDNAILNEDVIFMRKPGD